MGKWLVFGRKDAWNEKVIIEADSGDGALAKARRIDRTYSAFQPYDGTRKREGEYSYEQRKSWLA